MSKDETPKDKNVFRIMDGGIKSPQAPEGPAEDTIPQNPYVIIDVNGREHRADGFLLFTAQHVAVMRDTGEGALPILVIPLGMVSSARIIEPNEVTVELPF